MWARSEETTAEMPRRRPLDNKVLLSALAVFGLAGAGFLFVRNEKGPRDALIAPALPGSVIPEAVALPSAAPESPPAAAARPAPRPTLLDEKSLAEATELARPFMQNTVGKLDEGSALLALWATEHLTWTDLEAVTETSPALFRKDPEAERGKRLCFSGTIQEIRAERSLASRLIEDRSLPLIQRSTRATEQAPSPASSADKAATSVLSGPAAASERWVIPNDGKVFVAAIQARPPEPNDVERAIRTSANDRSGPVVQIIAVRSTGNLVDGSPARVCGILTGVTLPPTGVGWGDRTSPVHRLVGMFDLPENHTAKAAER